MNCRTTTAVFFRLNNPRELGKISQRRTQYLVDDGHRIEFTAGHAVAVHCPTLGRCLITSTEV
jgi:hypothetical protein